MKIYNQRYFKRQSLFNSPQGRVFKKTEPSQSLSLKVIALRLFISLTFKNKNQYVQTFFQAGD